MVRQKGTAKQPPQKRLQADPFHQPVKGFPAGVKRYIHLFPPDAAVFLQRGFHTRRGAVARKNLLDLCRVVCHAEHHHVLGRFPRSQRARREAERSHRLAPGSGGAGRYAGKVLKDGSRLQVGAAFPQKGLHGGIKRFRLLLVRAEPHNIVKGVVGPVAALIKGHRRLEHDAVCGGADAVQHGGHVAVVAEVVGAASVQRDGRKGDDLKRLAACVLYRYGHQFHIVPQRAEQGGPGGYAEPLGSAFQCVP